MQVEKTVFISCRKTNLFLARAIYDNLTARDYDCFLHPEVKPPKLFSRVVLDEIKTRAHFLVILTPSALQACAQPDHWLRSEIECAMEHKRNIIPLWLEGLDLPTIQSHMTGDLAPLALYDSLELSVDHLDKTMTRLRIRFLSKPTEAASKPPRSLYTPKTAALKALLGKQSPLTPSQLQDELYFEDNLNDADLINSEVEEYSHLIFFDLLHTSAYYKRAKAYEKKGNNRSALADYTQILKIDPSNLAAYDSRAVLNFKIGDLNAACHDYLRAIQLNPKHPTYHYCCGVVYQQNSKLAHALLKYLEAIRLDPLYTDAYYNRGLLYLDLNNFTAAIADFTQAINLNSQFAEAYNNRGLAKCMNKDLEGAIADFNEAIHINAACLYVYNNRGFAYWKQGEIEAAIADYDEAIRLYPNDALGYYTRGRLRFDLGQFQAAIIDYEAALQIDPENANVKEKIELARNMNASQS